MRKRNMRLAWTGLLMVVLAAAFFAGMSMLGPKSNNPAEMMRVVGQVSGVVGALGVVMALFGLVGKRA